MKTHVYVRSRYVLAVLLPTILMAAAFVYSLFLLRIEQNILFYAILIASGLVFCNFFFTLSVPRSISYDDRKIEFRGFGRTHTFYFETMEGVVAKDLGQKRSMYLRILNQGVLKGRYWVYFQYYNDGEALYEELKMLESKHKTERQRLLESYNRVPPKEDTQKTP